MDRINFLITDISLECMGNKFFDIYGTQVDSLFSLISAKTLVSKSTDTDDESDLSNSLREDRVPKSNKVKHFNRQSVAAAAAAAATAETVNKKQLKRRASFSMVHNEPDTADDPESLLTPMAPRAAKIANRRSTISVQLAKARYNKPSASSHPIPSPPKIRKQTAEAIAPNSKSISDIQQDLNRNTNARKYSIG